VTDAIPRRVLLPEVTLIEIRGADAVRYLNGQLTQDVRLAKPGGEALFSCVTDARGKLQFRVLIHGRNDGVVRISCEHEGAEDLFARLDRYLIADDAEMEDLTHIWRRVHVTGEGPPISKGASYIVPVNRIGLDGWDVWIPRDDEHEADDFPVWTVNEAETLRITAGFPVWGHELSAGMLPPEAGLDRTDVSYAKGCYIGQEVISRIKSAGKVNRRLMRIMLNHEAAAGDLLVDADGREWGSLTSVAPNPGESGRCALGYIKRGGADLPLFVNGDPITVACEA
jgi:folate-binding protein YgfZ